MVVLGFSGVFIIVCVFLSLPFVLIGTVACWLEVARSFPTFFSFVLLDL